MRKTPLKLFCILALAGSVLGLSSVWLADQGDDYVFHTYQSNGFYDNVNDYAAFCYQNLDNSYPYLAVVNRSGAVIYNTSVSGYNFNTDNHGMPNCNMDADGYIHVLWGSHNTQIQHYRSTNPRDYENFVNKTVELAAVDSAGTYGQYLVLNETLDVVTYMLDTEQDNMTAVFTTDNGDTWTTPKTFTHNNYTDMDNYWIMYTWCTQYRINEGKVYCFVNPTAEWGGVNYGYNGIGYIEIRADRKFYRSDGSEYLTPPGPLDVEYIFDSQAGGWNNSRLGASVEKTDSGNLIVPFSYGYTGVDGGVVAVAINESGKWNYYNVTNFVGDAGGVTSIIKHGSEFSLFAKVNSSGIGSNAVTKIYTSADAKTWVFNESTGKRGGPSQLYKIGADQFVQTAYGGVINDVYVYGNFTSEAAVVVNVTYRVGLVASDVKINSVRMG